MFPLDYLLIALVCASLPLCVWRPWIGVLLFTCLGYLTPHRLIGGIAYDFPSSKLVAAATLAGLIFSRQRAPLPRQLPVLLLFASWLLFLATTSLVATEPARAWEYFGQTSKVLLMTLVTISLFQDEGRLRILLLVIALSIGLLGIGGGVLTVSSAFQNRLYGPPESAFTDNNSLGFALTIALPLLAYLRQTERNPALRAVLLVTFACTLLAIFGTYSRGSFIGTCVVLGLLAVMLRLRDQALLFATAFCFVLLALAPRQWTERIQTITPTVYRSDSSGAQRMKSWYVAYRLGLDHPWLGAGFRPFSPAVYQRYLPGYSDYHDSHNHFLQIFAEHGFPGLLLFVTLLVSVAWSLWRIALPFGPALGDAVGDRRRAYAQMVAIAMVAYVVGGAFLNLPYFDLFYQLVAVTVVLQELASR